MGTERFDLPPFDGLVITSKAGQSLVIEEVSYIGGIVSITIGSVDLDPPVEYTSVDLIVELMNRLKARIFGK